MITYFNLKTSEGIETIDCINSKDFKTFKEFRTERKRIFKEYLKASNYFSGLYYSQKSTKEYNN